MEQITILVENKENVTLLSTLLKALDFVKSVKVDTVEVDVNNTPAQEVHENDADTDFFAVAGIWKHRDIDLAAIRKQAWPRQS